LDSTTATKATDTAMQLPAVDSGTAVLTTAGYLFLLLGVIFLAYWLLKRYGVPGALSGGADAPRLISRLMLGNRQSVAVVRFRDKDMVLGVTEDRITLLAEDPAGPETKPVAPGKSFSSLLKRSTSNAD